MAHSIATQPHTAAAVPDLYLDFFFFFFFNHHVHLPAQLVGDFTLSELLNKPWSLRRPVRAFNFYPA